MAAREDMRVQGASSLEQLVLLSVSIELGRKASRGAAAGATYTPHRTRLGRSTRWWGWQPDSLLYWAVLVQLCGALLFNLACSAGLAEFPSLFAVDRGAPTLWGAHTQDVLCIYVPSLIGGGCFTFASYVLLAEVTHSFNCFALPHALSLGYFVALFNLAGSALFVLAACGYFAQVPPFELSAGGPYGWEWQASEWGVRFPFGVGSACFVVAAAVSVPELLYG